MLRDTNVTEIWASGKWWHGLAKHSIMLMLYSPIPAPKNDYKVNINHLGNNFYLAGSWIGEPGITHMKTSDCASKWWTYNRQGNEC